MRTASGNPTPSLSTTAKNLLVNQSLSLWSHHHYRKRIFIDTFTFSTSLQRFSQLTCLALSDIKRKSGMVESEATTLIWECWCIGKGRGTSKEQTVEDGINALGSSRGTGHVLEEACICDRGSGEGVCAACKPIVGRCEGDKHSAGGSAVYQVEPKAVLILKILLLVLWRDVSSGYTLDTANIAGVVEKTEGMTYMGSFTVFVG